MNLFPTQLGLKLHWFRTLHIAINSKESADQAARGTNWTAGTNQTSSWTETHTNISQTKYNTDK